MVNSGSFDAGRLALLEQLAGGAPFRQVLDGIVRLIERQGDGLIGSILLLDREQGCVRAGAAPSLPPAFVAVFDGMAIGPTAGSCGAAAYRRERVIVDDIETHPNWADYRELARPHGLRACWSSPIYAPDGDVLGTFAMYYREPRLPTAAEIEWVDAAAHLAAIAIVHDNAAESLRVSEARARQLARLYAVSSGINEAIVREGDPARLYERACRIAVEQEFARFAWVGLHDPATDLLTPVVTYGVDAGYLDGITLNLNDPASNQGPAGRAMRSGTFAVSNDIAADPGFRFKTEALARGFRSCAVFPLAVGGRPFGVFAIYMDRVNGFGHEESTVLNEVAADLSFAVASLQAEQERRRLSRDLGDAEQLRALIFDSVADVIFYLAVEPDGRFRFLSVNKAFLVATGLDEAAVTGRLVDAVIPEPSLSIVLGKYRQAIRTGQPVQWEEVSQYPSGVRHGEVTVTPIVDAAGRCTNLLGTVHDITGRVRAQEEQRRLEQQLHQAQRMQSLGTLAGGIAHDFNNVLAAVRGHAELAQAELQEAPGNHAVAESLVEIVKGARRAGSLAGQILAFSRRAEPKRERIDIGAVIREALTLLRATLPGNVVVRADIAPDMPGISADSTQIHQILINLVTNAAQAIGSQGGSIDIATGRITVGGGVPCAALADGDYVKLTVADGGPGMDAATQARIFEPFFTTKPPGQGTGLGLAVVHGIMTSHQGSVTVRSELGRGTTFDLYFPAAARPSDVARPPVAAGSRGDGKHILYVDDEEALVFLTRRVLGRLGYEVTGYSDPVHALQDFRARPQVFDAVVTDTSMPGLSGPDLVRELRRIRPDVPIVVVSGFLRQDDAEAIAALNVEQVILKPQTATELTSVLHEVIHGRRHVRPAP